MPTPRIKEFLANLDIHSGPAKSERFFVQITPPMGLPTSFLYSLSLSYQCEVSEIPGVR